MTELTNANYTDEIANSPKALILCYKDQCPHCMNIKKVINKYLSVSGDDLPVFMLNSEKEEELMKKLDAELVPTTCLLKEGELVHTKKGLYNYKELRVIVQGNL